MGREKQILLGDLIDAFDCEFNPELPVYIGNTERSIHSLESYRGYYDQLAIEPSHGSPDAMKSGDFASQCRNANGSFFAGYKGGIYRMGRETPVWIADYGYTSCEIASGIFFKDDKCIIETHVLSDDEQYDSPPAVTDTKTLREMTRNILKAKSVEERYAYLVKMFLAVNRNSRNVSEWTAPSLLPNIVIDAEQAFMDAMEIAAKSLASNHGINTETIDDDLTL